MEEFAIVIPAMIVPLALLFFRPAVAALAFVGLIPVFMYHKSMFAVVEVAGMDLQWPTLSKDLVAILMFIVLFAGIFYTQSKLAYRKPVIVAVSALAAFSVFVLASALANGVGPVKAVMGLRPYLLFPALGLLCGIALLNWPQYWKSYGQILLLAMVVVAVIALVHTIYPTFLIHESFKGIWQGNLVDFQTFPNRLNSYFTAANVLGWFMALGVLVALYLIRLEDAGGNRLWFVFTITVFMVVLTLSQSRSALLALGLGVIAWSVFLTRRGRLVVLIGAVVIGSAVLTLTTYQDRFVDLQDNPRLSIWSGYLAATLKSPKSLIIGNGVGSVGRFGAEVEGSDVDIDGLAGIGSEESGVFFIDSFYVSSIYLLGMGGAFFVVVSLWVYWIAWNTARGASGELRRLAVLPVLVMTLVLAISFFSPALTTYPWNFLYWLSAGSVFGVRRNLGLPVWRARARHHASPTFSIADVSSRQGFRRRASAHAKVQWTSNDPPAEPGAFDRWPLKGA